MYCQDTEEAMARERRHNKTQMEHHLQQMKVSTQWLCNHGYGQEMAEMLGSKTKGVLAELLTPKGAGYED